MEQEDLVRGPELLGSWFKLKTRSRSRELSERHQGNAQILSRFKWSTDSTYKKWMVVMFIFLIFLFLFRDPIIRYLQHVPEPPAIDLGHCEAEGDLNVAHVHVAPGASSDVITIMFSTNVRTNSMLALQYGVDENMEYETFVSKAEIGVDKSKYPYVHLATVMLLSPGELYYYRVSCGDFHSKTYQFQSIKSETAWSPKVKITNDLSVKKEDKDMSLQVEFGDIGLKGDKDLDGFMNRIENLNSRIPSVFLPSHTADRTNLQEYFNLFSLPGAEWPLEDETFYTVIGQLQIIGFNALHFSEDKTGFARSNLIHHLKECNIRRKTMPWVILMSHEPVMCTAENARGCENINSLMHRYGVDLYLVGQSKGYLRSWPIAVDDSVLNTYHYADGYVLVSLGMPIPTGNNFIEWMKRLNPKAFMINLSRETLITATLDLPIPEKLCLIVRDSSSEMHIDDFCIERTAAMNSVAGRSRTSNAFVGYNSTAWLVLVIVLAVAFVVLLIFRHFLYSKLCIYIKSDGGPPLIYNKLLPV